MLKDKELFFIKSIVKYSALLECGVVVFEYFTSYDAMKKRIDYIDKYEPFYKILDQGEAWIYHDILCPNSYIENKQ